MEGELNSVKTTIKDIAKDIALVRFLKNLTKAISVALSLIVVFTLFTSPSIAAKTSMTGDYAKDTISVVKTLQTAVDLSLIHI